MRWIDLIRTSGDGNMGQTLLRLASLAESAHHFEVARRLPAPLGRAGESVDEDGADRIDLTAPGEPGTEAGPTLAATGIPRRGVLPAAQQVHREVDR